MKESTSMATFTRTEDGVIAVCGKKTLTLNFSEISDKVIKPLVLRGVTDKTRDSYAGAKSKGLTLDEVAEMIQESFDNFREGIFNAGRSGVSRTTILIEALARVKKISIVDAKTLVDGLDDEQLKSLSGHKLIKQTMAEISAERAKASVAELSEEELEDSLNDILG